MQILIELLLQHRYANKMPFATGWKMQMLFAIIKNITLNGFGLMDQLF